MSSPAPVLYETTTTTPLAEFDFGTLASPVTSATETFDLANADAAAETMTEVSIGAEESHDGGATFADDGVICRNRWLQIRATDQSGTGIVAQTTAWTPVGLGADLYVKPIPANCRRVLKARLVIPPSSLSSTGVKIKIIPRWFVKTLALGVGAFETGQRGVVSGSGDPTYTELLAGGTLAATGSPDGNVNLTDTLIARVAGALAAKYAGATAIAASASGKARWVTLSWDGSGALTQTASSEVTAPAPVGDRQATPAGEVFLGYVYRDDGSIDGADIYQDAVLRAGFYFSSSGLDFVVGPGRGVVANTMVYRDQTQTGTLAASATTILYLVPEDGSVSQVLSGSLPPSLRAEPIWKLTTDGSGVTATVDLRRWAGANLLTFEAFFAGTVATNDARYWTMPVGRPGYVHLPRGCELSAGDIGGRAAGNLDATLEYWDGAAWTSLFSDTAKRPKLAYNASPPSAGGFVPDTTRIEGGTRLRWRIAGLPTGGATDPSNVFARVYIEEAPV